MKEKASAKAWCLVRAVPIAVLEPAYTSEHFI